MMRCFDCLADLPEAPRYWVLKQNQDIPEDADGWVVSMCFTPQRVCAECVGWYGGDVFTEEDHADEERWENVVDLAAEFGLPAVQS